MSSEEGVTKNGANSTTNGGYQEPSALLKRLFIPPKTPSLSLSSDYTWLIYTGQPPLPSIELLSKPEEKLAGIRFDPVLLAPSRLDYCFDLKAQHLSLKSTESPEITDIPLPSESEGIRYIRFNPNPPKEYAKQQFVFTSKRKNKNLLELYVCNLIDENNNWVIHPVPALEGKRLNFVNGCAYQFTSDGKSLLCKVVPENHPLEPPSEPTVPIGPSIQNVGVGAKKAPGRTYQDLLRNQHDENKFKYYLTTELMKVDMTSDNIKYDSASIVIQSKGGFIPYSIESSPCGRYLLVESITDLSYSVPMNRFGKDIAVWDLLAGEERKTANIILPVVSKPVDDEIPLSFDGCSRHKRQFQFHPCFPHTLLYAHALDGGDPKNDPVVVVVDEGDDESSSKSYRDAIYTQGIIQSDNTDELLSLQEPVVLCRLEWRYDDIDFTESGNTILIDEYRWNDRMERKWKISIDSSKKLVWERTWEDRYNSPGVPIHKRGANGKYFIREPSPGTIYLKGAGASPLGDRPFLDRMNLDTSTKERVWRCKAPKEGDIPNPTTNPLAPSEVGGKIPTDDERDDVYESLVVILDDNDTILISRESKTTPTNYYLTSLTTSNNTQTTITTFPHPQPDLIGVDKELVQYKRKDGVELTANLYLPSNYDGTPRPTLFWAYPREFKNSKAAGQIKGSKHRFVSAHWASPIHWAAKGWVVMDDFSLPIIGEGEAKPNDTFIEQIVSGATAAVEYVTKTRGISHPDKCAVGGHSYGSFMTSHLLSHTDLFAAGIGRSGAFNRTLTPMSFQSEDRSMWEAPDTYITMSPLMHVKKYSEQERVGKLLLIHGEVDENSGTHPLQSERYFAALKAFGIESRLCILPHERHSYRAKESILHMAWEQEEWLKSLE